MGALVKTIEVEVAPRHTVRMPVPPLEIKDGDKVVRIYQRGRPMGPGSRVHVSREEADSLRRRGFIVDGDAPIIPTGMGPMFTSESGVSIKPQA